MRNGKMIKIDHCQNLFELLYEGLPLVLGHLIICKLFAVSECDFGLGLWLYFSATDNFGSSRRERE